MISCKLSYNNFHVLCQLAQQNLIFLL